MAAKKKAAATADTEVTLKATPDTEVTIETSPKAAASPPAAGGILQAVKENPVAAGMVWLGLGWIVLAGSRAKSQVGGQSPADVAAKTQEAITDVASRTQETVGSVATKTQQTLGSVTAKTQETASTAVSSVQQGARAAGTRVQGVARTARFVTTSTASEARRQATIQASRVREGAQEIVSEKPVALELAAVAAGAVAGLVLPKTSAEEQLLGRTRDQVIEKLDTAGEQALTKVEQAIEPQPQPAPAARLSAEINEPPV